MREAAAEQEYERAARLRDDTAALRRAMEKQTVVLADDTDADVVALAEDQLEAAVQVFFVRGGRVRGQRGWVVEKVEDVTTADLVEHFVTQLYGETDTLVGAAAEVPREVLVPVLPTDLETVTEWLCERRGSRVDFRIPQRGDKRALMETVARNAAQSLVLHKTRRAGDLTARGRALQEIQDALGLEQAPLSRRWWCSKTVLRARASTGGSPSTRWEPTHCRSTFTRTPSQGRRLTARLPTMSPRFTR
jgi:excinuclease ABC subunit C